LPSSRYQPPEDVSKVEPVGGNGDVEISVAIEVGDGRVDIAEHQVADKGGGRQGCGKCRPKVPSSCIRQHDNPAQRANGEQIGRGSAGKNFRVR